MLIFIDESGDSGFKITQGSSSHFVIALVIFDEDSDATETANKIKQFKTLKHLSTKYEFKFNKMNRLLRLEFLEEIKGSKFRIRALIVDKEKSNNFQLHNGKNQYYSYFLKEILKQNSKSISNAKLRLDGQSEREFRKAFNTYLRKELNKSARKKIMRDLKFVDSREDILIQLADMIAGAIKCSYQKSRNDSEIYKNIIKKKIEDEWLFGK